MESLARDLAALLQDCVVAIESANRGTGFFIAPGLVATCNHVVENADVVDVVWRGTKLRGTVLRTEETAALAARDLALVAVADGTKDAPCVRLDPSCDPFTQCYGYGFSDLRPTGDPVAVMVEGPTGDSLIKLSNSQIRPGLSGSPLINLRTGDVCGVIKRTRDRNTALGGLAIPVSVLLSHDEVARAHAAYHATNARWSKLALKQSAKPVAAPEADANLVQLRKTVKRFWVEEYLEQSLAGLALMELDKESDPSKVAAPWRRQLRLESESSERLPSEYSIATAFEDFEGSLLILGAPGAGKTTSLIELAAELIRKSEAGESEAVPVILNLSTWRPGRTIQAWLLDEVSATYHFPRHLTKKWLAARQLIPMFDGLDETRESDRDACAAAINEFLRDAGTRVAICSRSVEYDTITTRLEVNGSILLLPLDDARAMQYLESLGATHVKSLLENDAALFELARSPLLLNITILAYHGRRAAEAAVPAGASLEERRAQLFDAYIEAMYERRTDQRYTKPYSLTILARIAALMQRDAHSVLLIENLQPTWLPSAWQRMVYYAVTRYVPLILMFGAYRSGRLLFNVLAPLLGGIAVGLFDLVRLRPAMRHSVLRYIGRGAAYLLLLSAVAYLLLSWKDPAERLDESVAFGFFAFLLCLKGIRRSSDNDIEPVERLGWSWRRALRAGGIGLLIGSLMAVGMAGRGLFGEVSNGWDLLWGILGGVIGLGGVFALCAAMFGGWTGTVHTGKTRPNQGMFLTMRNSLIAGLVAAILPVSLMTAIMIISEDSSSLKWIAAPLFLLWLAVIWCGGMDVIRHYTLRLVLWISRVLPLRMARFLQYGTHLAFLQRVGGGFVFIHRLFLEHFSAKAG